MLRSTKLLLVAACVLSGCSDADVTGVEIDRQIAVIGFASFSAALTFPGTVTLTWSNPTLTPYGSYTLERRTYDPVAAAWGEWSGATNLAQSVVSYVDAAVAPGVHYMYRLKACEAFFSCSEYVFVEIVTKAFAPTDLAATSKAPDFGVTTSTKYRYRLRACNVGGCSAWISSNVTTTPD